MTYKFDEKMYVVGDAYILHRFVTDDEGHSKEEKIWGILSDYKPNKLCHFFEDIFFSSFRTIDP